MDITYYYFAYSNGVELDWMNTTMIENKFINNITYMQNSGSTLFISKTNPLEITDARLTEENKQYIISFSLFREDIDDDFLEYCFKFVIKEEIHRLFYNVHKGGHTLLNFVAMDMSEFNSLENYVKSLTDLSRNDRDKG